MGLGITDICFGYGKAPLFERVSAEGLPRGSITAVVGPNGVGKSSLFRLIAGLRKPIAGAISLDGRTWRGCRKGGGTRRSFFCRSMCRCARPAVFDVVLLARKSGQGGARQGRGYREG